VSVGVDHQVAWVWGHDQQWLGEHFTLCTFFHSTALYLQLGEAWSSTLRSASATYNVLATWAWGGAIFDEQQYSRAVCTAVGCSRGTKSGLGLKKCTVADITSSNVLQLGHNNGMKLVAWALGDAMVDD
jgi:hypothetical protein